MSNRDEIMQRHIIYLLTLVIALTSLVFTGCKKETISFREPPEWTEKQVIEYLYRYLIDNAGRLQSSNVELEKAIIKSRFSQAITKAMVDVTDPKNTPLKSEDMNSVEFDEATLGLVTFKKAVEKIAHYIDDDWWSVSIENAEWRINEESKEVVAWNDLAVSEMNGVLTQKTPAPISQLSDLIKDSRYLNTSWDAIALYSTLISIAQSYHQAHFYIEGKFDYDDMAVDIWNILYKQGITSEIVIGNLDINDESLTQSNHTWLVVMHKDTGYRFFIIEPTNGETYAFNPDTMEFAQYLQGYVFVSPADFEVIADFR